MQENIEKILETYLNICVDMSAEDRSYLIRHSLLSEGALSISGKMSAAEEIAKLVEDIGVRA